MAELQSKIDKRGNLLAEWLSRELNAFLKTNTDKTRNKARSHLRCQEAWLINADTFASPGSMRRISRRTRSKMVLFFGKSFTTLYLVVIMGRG
jgi:hypothetical protein